MEEAERLSKKRGRANADEAEDWTMMPFSGGFSALHREGEGGEEMKGKGESRERETGMRRACGILEITQGGDYSFLGGENARQKT